MGLALVAAVAVAALTLLALASVALVQLVLMVSVRRTAIVLAALSVYWFISSRRRRVAKGFYSCKELPGDAASVSTKRTASRTAEKLAPKRKEKRENASETKAPKGTTLEPGTAKRSADAKNSDKHTKEPEDEQGLQAKGTPNMEVAELSGDEMPRGGLAATFASVDPATPPRLPELRRKNWTTPNRSLPIRKKGGERLLRHTGGSPSSSPASGSGSPRDRELFGSPRSVALEQKLMKNALESEGYWIGDFRLPPPVQPRRTQSSGGRTQSTGAATHLTSQHEAPRSMRIPHQF